MRVTRETAWLIEQDVVGGTEKLYTRLDHVAASMIEDENATVMAVGYEDMRSEWEKLMSLPEMGTEMPTTVDHERAVEAINFDLVAKHIDEHTSEEMQRVGTDWEDASVAERTAFALLVEKLDRMSRRASRMLNSPLGGGE